MDIKKLNTEVDALVSKGEILAAISKFFADGAATSDHDGTVKNSKKEHLAKIEAFLGGIAKVNSITFHYSGVGDDVSMSEFTFDFDMKDGSKVLWHEILRRVWKDGKIVDEKYFLG
ncbi:MAG TPA: hypothetical protein VL727_03770 [Puia sp.]|jgi:hypothetical protein|nr:hypothetical protein [Puia sp.]